MADCFVAGIGASSGGMHALFEFFKNVKPGMNIAYVVIRHLSRDFPSQFPELLQKYTDLKINTIKGGEELKADEIYVLPENKKVYIKDNILHLVNRPEKEIVNHAVDFFLCSLAEDRKEKAIGVVLSGVGHDGSACAIKITNYGGLNVVQDPQSTQHNGMPMNVIEKDHPKVMQPDDIPEFLRMYTKEK
ncbi:MAG: chemotaxis protein CheB [Cytophagaceae bacterium]